MNQSELQHIGRLLILLSQAWNGRSRELDQQLVALRNQLMSGKPNMVSLLPHVRRLERKLAAMSADTRGPVEKLVNSARTSTTQLLTMDEIPRHFRDELEALSDKLGDISDLQSWQPWLDGLFEWHKYALKTLASSRKAAGQSSEQLLLVVREQVIELLDQLIEQKLYVQQAEQLRGQVNQIPLAQMQRLLSQSVALAIRSINQERSAFEVYLRDLDGALGRVQQLLAPAHEGVKQQADLNDALRETLDHGFGALRQGSLQASSLTELQQSLIERLDALDHQLDGKYAELQQVNTQQKQRLAELELELQRAQAQGFNYKQQLQRLTEQSRIDRLTGIPNRIAYEERLQVEIAGAASVEHPLALAVIDIDHFKHINDSYGHQAGDRILTAVAQAMRGFFRPDTGNEFVARYGGEEFVILLPGLNEIDALARLDAIRQKVAAMPFRFRAEALSVTVSAGVATLLPAESGEALFERADQALYCAKQQGRNQCCPANADKLLAEHT